MLENLNETVCVSKHFGQEQSLWSCYEPLKKQGHSRRQVWKRLTGLLSTSDMEMHLEQKYNSREITEKFNTISK